MRRMANLKKNKKNFFITFNFLFFIYYFSFIVNYIFYLNPVWGYQGFSFDFQWGRDEFILAFGFILSAISANLLGSNISRYSDYVAVFIVFFVYIPTTVIFSMQNISGVMDKIYLHTALFLAILGIIMIPRGISLKKPQKFHNKKVKSRGTFDYEIWILISFAIILIVVFFLFYDIMSISSLKNVYGQRFRAAENIMNGTIEAYLLSWTVRVIAPFALAVGLIFKDLRFFFMSIIAFLIHYSITASKFIIFQVALTMVVYFFLLRSGPPYRVLRFSLILVGAFLATLAFVLVLHDKYDVNQTYVGLLSSQILKRAYSISGLTMINYYEFFSENPLLYYSHIRYLQWLVEYPYGNLSPGEMLGYYLFNNEAYDITAGFLVRDGLASLWFPGITVAGIFLGIILRFFNYIIDIVKMPYYMPLIMLSTIGNVWMLADANLTQVLLSGGWILHFILSYLYIKGRISRVSRA